MDQPGEDEARERLARLVRERRQELSLSVRRAAALASIDRATWANAEGGHKRTADFVYGGLERALQWEAGSIEAILTGGQPIELDEPTAAATRKPSLEEQLRVIRDNPNKPAAMRRQARLLLEQMEAIVEAAQEDEEERARRGTG